MLVLGRKLGETIIINDMVEVKVVGVSGGRVKLAIDAPREVPVQRGELLDRDQGSCREHYGHGRVDGSLSLRQT